MEAASGLLKQGRISQEEYNQAVDQAKEKLDAASGASKKFFGQDTLQTLTGMVAGALSLSAAVKAVGDGFQFIEQIKERAAQRAAESEMPLGELAQLTGGNMDKYRELVEAAKKTAAEGGAPSVGAAAKLVYGLESAGALGERKFFSELGSTGVSADPLTLARASRTIQTSMGEERAGSLREIVSMGFGATPFSPNRPEEILEGVSRAMIPGRTLGISPEEILAAGAVTSSATGDVREAATKEASFLRAVVRLRAGQTGETEGGQSTAIADLLAPDEDAAPDKIQQRFADHKKDLQTALSHSQKMHQEAREHQLKALEKRRGRLTAAQYDAETAQIERKATDADADSQAKYDEAMRRAERDFSQRENAQLSKEDRQAAKQAKLAQAQDLVAKLKGAQTIQEMVGALKTSGLDEAQVMKLLGRKEAYEFVGLADLNAGQIQTAMGAIRKARESDQVGKMMGLPATEATQAAAGALRRAKAEADVAMEGMGDSTSLLQALYHKRQAAAARDADAVLPLGLRLWGEWAGEGFASIEDRLGGSDTRLERVLKNQLGDNLLDDDPKTRAAIARTLASHDDLGALSGNRMRSMIRAGLFDTDPKLRRSLEDIYTAKGVDARTLATVDRAHAVPGDEGLAEFWPEAERQRRIAPARPAPPVDITPGDPDPLGIRAARPAAGGNANADIRGAAAELRQAAQAMHQAADRASRPNPTMSLPNVDH